jgi:hypothetical protein
MNKLFGIAFATTFVFLSTDNFWGWAIVGIVAMLLLLPYTTPETFGEKKK